MRAFRRAVVLLVLSLAILARPGPAQTTSGSLSSGGPFDRYRVLAGRDTRRIVITPLPIRLAIGLVVEQQQICVSGLGPFQVRVAGKVFQARPGDRWTARRLGGRAAVIEHLLVVRSFPPGEAMQASELAARLCAKGYQAGVVSVGLRLVLAARGEGGRGRGASREKVVDDGRSLLVHVGRYRSAEAARQRLQVAIGRGEGPWLHERVAMPQSGVLALVGPDGKERGRGRSVTWSSPAGLKMLGAGRGPDRSSAARPDRRYAGVIHAVFDRKGLLAAVNEIELEPYLKGVVPSEIPASDPPEAIRAQAVAARSETLSKLVRGHAGQPFDLCSEEHCQVYSGLEQLAPSTNRGVEETRGLVVCRGESLLEAVYCDTCGGHTENIENVWSASADPSLVGVVDGPSRRTPFPRMLTEESLSRWLSSSPPAYCRGPEAGSNSRYRWTVELSGPELDARVNRHHRVGRVRALVPVERGVSGRLRLLRIVGDRGQVVVHKELPIRRVLGDLMSALFVVRAHRGADGRVARWQFVGAGWGHGVGLCQVGARWAARSGLGYRAILAHYFRGTTISRLYR